MLTLVQWVCLTSAVTALAVETACDQEDHDSAALLQGPPTKRRGGTPSARTSTGAFQQAPQASAPVEEGDAASLLSLFGTESRPGSSKAPPKPWNAFFVWSRQMVFRARSQCAHFLESTKNAVLLQSSQRVATEVAAVAQRAGMPVGALALLFFLLVALLAGCLAMGLTFMRPMSQKFTRDSLLDTASDSSGKGRSTRRKTHGRRTTQSFRPRARGFSLDDEESAESEAEINNALRPYASARRPMPLTMRPMQRFAAELMPQPSGFSGEVGIPLRSSVAAGSAAIEAVLAPELVVPDGHECIIHIPIFSQGAPPEYTIVGPDGTSVLRVVVDSSPTLGWYSGVRNSMHLGAGQRSQPSDGMILERILIFDPEGSKPHALLELMLADGDAGNVQAFLVSGGSHQQFLAEETRNGHGQRALLLVDPVRRESTPALVAQVHDESEGAVTFSSRQRFLGAHAEPGRLASGAPCSVLNIRPGIDVALVVLALFVLERTEPPEFDSQRIQSPLVPASLSASLPPHKARKALSR